MVFWLGYHEMNFLAINNIPDGISHATTQFSDCVNHATLRKSEAFMFALRSV